MAATKLTEDWAYFTVVQRTDGTLTLTRIADPHHRSSLLQAVAYVDAVLLDKAAEDSATAKDGKVTVVPTPGVEALTLAGITLANRHTYIIKYA